MPKLLCVRRSRPTDIESDKSAEVAFTCRDDRPPAVAARGMPLPWSLVARLIITDLSQLHTVFGAVLPVVLVIIAGWIMRVRGLLTGEADASMIRMTINVLVPCLAFDALLGNRALSEPGNLWLPPLFGFGAVLLGLLAGLAVKRWVPARTPQTGRTFAFSVAVFNYSYIPLPLALALFDRETVAVLFVFNVGVEIGFWVFGLLVLAGLGPLASWRRLVSPPLVTIVLTLVLNALIGGREAVPEFVLSTAHLLGQCAIPMGLLLSGATMADHAEQFVRERGGRVMALACLLRLGVLPALFLLIGRVLPAPVELKQVIVLQAAMPAAVFPVILARHYGGDPVTALRVIVATSLVALVTIPLWIRFGMGFLGPF